MQKYTYHCHTNFSDGKNSIDEMLAQAVKLGFTEIGITDHLQVHKNYPENKKFKFRGRTFSEIKANVDNHIKSVREAAKKYPIDVLVGFEIDYLAHEGWYDDFIKFTKTTYTDYLIAGNHYIMDAKCEIFKNSVLEIDEVDKSLLNEYMKTHFAYMIESINCGAFTFLAHADFVRWGRACGEFDYKDERMAVIEALAKTNTPTEINTKGMKYTGDFYPAKWMLKEMNAHKVPIVISDDAHSTDTLGSYFKEAEQRLDEVGYKHRFDLKHLIKKD